MIAVALLVFLVLLTLGVPVAFAIGAAGLAGLAWSGEFPLIIIMQQIHQSVDSFVLLAIPLFIFAGMLMETGGIAVRLVHLAQALRLSFSDLFDSFRKAIIPLGQPAIIFGGILGGVMTPTEAASLAVLYAAIVGLFVYREIRWRDLPAIMARSAVVTATVCFLLAVAAVIAWMLAVAQVPAAILSAMQAISAGPITFLILTAALFIVLGAVLEGLPAVVILVPTFLPVVKQMNIDLIHYSIVVTAATGIGLFLPPIGVGLFIACGIAGVTIDRVTREMMPYVTMLSFGLLLVIVFPWLTLVLPRVFGL